MNITNHHNISRRRHMTLLELLIAMGLSVIVLTTLSYFYRDIDGLNREMDRTQKESFQLLYVENRLANILPKTLSESGKDKKDFYFFTNSNTRGFFKEGSTQLIFAYDNGNQLNKEFSNNVLGLLYLNKRNSLYLATWPSPKRWPEMTPPPMREELLLENVTQLKFSFYIPPEQDRSAFGVAFPPLEGIESQVGTWVTEWKSEYKQLPTLIKIELIKKHGEEDIPMTFAFPFPNSKKFILYRS